MKTNAPYIDDEGYLHIPIPTPSLSYHECFSCKKSGICGLEKSPNDPKFTVLASCDFKEDSS